MNWDLPLDDGGIAARPLELDAICLTEAEQQQAASLQDPTDPPEQAWTRYLRALALIGLRRWLKQRDAGIVVGPELEPEAPDRLLAIGGRATQLLCASSLAEGVAVPLTHWKQTATSPQLALLALVDEENAVVEFPGVIDAAALIAEIQKVGGGAGDAIDLPTALFQGGLERLLRWTTLLEPGALRRRWISEKGSVGTILKNHLRDWGNSLVASNMVLLPITISGGTRSGTFPSKWNSERKGHDTVDKGIRLLNPAIVRAGSGECVALAVCARPTIWANTSLAEIQIWKNSELIWRQKATVDKPIHSPFSWPLDNLSPIDKLTICLRPYGSRVGEQAVFTLIAAESIQAQLNEKQILKHLEDLSDSLASSSEESHEPELIAEIMARVALSLSADENRAMIMTRNFFNTLG
jgi:hypothetical protein